MTQVAFISQEHRIAVFWSPHCGSRSLAQWFFESFTDAPPDWRDQPGKYLGQIGAVKPYGTALAMASRGGYLQALATRHPARRALSAYTQKFLKPRRLRMDRLDRIEPYVRLIIEDVKGRHPELEAFPGVSFRDFVGYLHRHYEQRHSLNDHWGPQFPLQSLRKPIRFHHVLATETLSDDLGALNQRLGLSQPAPHRNRSSSALEPDEEAPASLVHLPPQELLGRALHPRSFLNPEVLEVLAGFYADDYRLLGYDPYDIDSRHQLVPAPLPGPLGRLILRAGDRVRSLGRRVLGR